MLYSTKENPTSQKSIYGLQLYLKFKLLGFCFIITNIKTVKAPDARKLSLNFQFSGVFSSNDDFIKVARLPIIDIVII